MQEHYQDLNGNSGINSFEIGDNYIDINFRDQSNSSKSHYRYSHLKPGLVHVEKMKALAQQGKGLNSYIMLNVKKNYERKW